jgi:hypothetical protein
VRTNGSTSWAYFDSLVFVAHRATRPTDGDFAEFKQDVDAHTGLTGIVVVANDNPPSPGQRAQIQQWFEECHARGAVMTDSVLARGAVTALSWFGVPIRAFARRQTDAALEFVGVPQHRLAEARDVLNALIDNVEEPQETTE